MISKISICVLFVAIIGVLLFQLIRVADAPEVGVCQDDSASKVAKLTEGKPLIDFYYKDCTNSQK